LLNPDAADSSKDLLSCSKEGEDKMITRTYYNREVSEPRLKGLLERIRITKANLDATLTGIKSFSIIFGLQLILYCVVTINTRAISQASISATVFTDFGIAALNWATIRLISKHKDNAAQFVSYLLGSISGSTIGILLSKSLLGS
jgi:hypothetical protein